MQADNPIKVLHIISDLRRGGRERQLSILVNYSNPTIEHHIIAFHKSENSYLNEYLYKNLVFVNGNRLKRIGKIYKYMKQNNFKLIHTWGNSETLYALPIAKITGVPLLNGSIRHGIRLNTFSHRFRSIVLKASKYILGNSYAGYEANKITINRKRHFVIYNGIEEKFFVTYNQKKRNQFNSTYNLPNDSIVLISIANFVPYKDYTIPLKVFSDLIKEGYPIFYIIIGKGILKDEVEKQIKKLDISDKVIIHSDNPDIPSLLSITDILIHSSLGEGCSNAILEASSAGLISVASDTGGTKEIINEWGFLYEYKNENELLNKIKEAIKLYRSDPDIRRKIQKKTKELFSVNALVENYYRIISSIV